MIMSSSHILLATFLRSSEDIVLHSQICADTNTLWDVLVFGRNGNTFAFDCANSLLKRFSVMLTLLLVTTGRFGLLVKKQVYAHLWLLISTFHAPSRQRIDSLPLNTTGTLFNSLNSYQKILQLCHTGLDPQYGRSFFFAKSWLLHYLPMGKTKSLFCLHEPTVNNKILQVTWRTCFSFTHDLQR